MTRSTTWRTQLSDGSAGAIIEPPPRLEGLDMNFTGAPAKGASSARIDDFWDKLTDDQLFEIQWFTDDPLGLENLQPTIPTDLTDFQVELAYELTPADPAVPCAHCPQHQPHRHGFVVKAADGRRFLLGSVCGPKAYRADYRIASQARQRKFRRYKALVRCRELHSKLPDLIEALTEAESAPGFVALRRMRAAFAAMAPNTLGRLRLLRPHTLTGAIELKSTIWRRDEAAEKARDRDYTAEMLKIADLPNREHGRRLSELKRRYGVGSPINIMEEHDFGVLRGAEWLLSDRDHFKRTRDVIQRLHGLRAVMHTTRDKTTAYLEKLPNAVREEVETAAVSLAAIRAAGELLERASLERLSGWLGSRPPPAPKASLVDGALVVEEVGQPRPAVLKRPLNWVPPGDLFMELAAERL